MKHSAGLDPFGVHTLVEDPAAADIILFAEMGSCGKFTEMVRAHALYRSFPEKCFVFDTGDFFFPTVPGLYASLTREQFDLGYARTGFYLYLIENAFITPRPYSGREKYLASFVGSRLTHAVRQRLFELKRSDIYMKDTSAYGAHTTRHGEPGKRAKFWEEYAESIADSRFSLCPRGRGTGSIRLFESMKMGRACVIISDDWVPNDHVNWEDFSIRVQERDVHRIPEILEREVQRAPEMGTHARRAWEEHFSEKVRFHRIVEQCLEISSQINCGTVARFTRTLRQTADPRNLRWYLSSKKDLYRNTGKIYW
ncbi:MAG TPA: exostosin family protein [Silvibacterium sp.]|nr:exostosin family protein [Silvibacterium sp.]